MEQFVLGIFQEELSKVIVGFKKEQVDANLLNGKGQIRDVNINCSFINDALCKVAPFIQLESIRVSKLGFHVTSWTNLKKAPILVDIEDLEVVIVEPLTYVDKAHRLAIKQLSWTEFREIYNKDKKFHRGPYNLFDRILDNLQIEIRSINITFQTRGRFKTQREGPWTPPALHVQLRHLKYYSVDAFGNEADPDDCWRHNKFEGHPRDQTLLVYKKASMHMSVGFRQAGDQLKALPPLIKDAQVDVDLVFHKKFSNGAILSIQLDATLDQIQIDVEHETVPVLAHTIAGMQYCFTKDRAFDDPLLSVLDCDDTARNVELAAAPALRPSTPAGSVGEGDESNDDDDTSQEKGAESCNDEDSQSFLAEEASIDGSVDNSDFDGEEKVDDDLEMPQDLAPADADTVSFTPHATKKKKSKSKDRPVILLPSGLVIYSKLSLSVSIHNLEVRGTYDTSKDGCIQLQLKGLVAEMIWPKVTREKGCYMQMSLSHITILETHEKKTVTLLRGGTRRDAWSGPIEAPSMRRTEISRDENFPRFEDRSVRPDPLDLRHCFPVQAIGLKATVNVVDKISDPEHEEIMVLYEIGIDVIEVIANSESWCRAVRFALHDTGGGFDPRWRSGDWGDSLATDMMRNPLQPFILSDFLQTNHQNTRDGNDMISSDLVNLTAKLSHITVKAPAAIQRDLRSCDIVAAVDELMVIISSALPRKFLKGKIGSSVDGNGSTNDGIIDFPNDPSDVCYALAMHSSRRDSTFRAQLTTRGLTVKTLPIIPFFDAASPRNVLAPLDMTMIFCFEGERTSPDSDSIKIDILHSMEISHLDVNCDVDMITGAMSTIFYQCEVVGEAMVAIKKLPGFEAAYSTIQTRVSVDEDDTEDEARRSVGGEKGVLARQLERSRETGGFNVDLSVHLASIGLHVWRQNVPLNSRFRESMSGDRAKIDEHPVPLIELLSMTVKNIEVGFEACIQPQKRRLVLKSCFSQLQIDVCDFEKTSARHLEVIYDRNDILEREGDALARESDGKVSRSGDLQNEITPSSRYEFHDDKVSLLRMGCESEKDITLRLEDYCVQGRSFSVAVDLDAGSDVTLHIHEIEMFFLLAIEALLLPTQIKPLAVGVDCIESIQFPEGSVGALLLKGFRLNKRPCKPTASRIDVKTLAVESDSLDQLMHTLILGFLPEDTSEFFVRFSVGDLLIFIPPQSGASNRDDENSPWVCHRLREANLLTGFIASSRATDGLVSRLGQKGVTWSSLFPQHQSGFHHKINTSHSLYSADHDGARVVLKKALIDAFDLGLTYDPHSIGLSMGDSTLSLQDLHNLRSLYSSIVAFVQRSNLMRHRIDSVASAMTRKRADQERVSNSPVARIVGGDKVTGFVAADEAEFSLQKGRNVLEQLKRVFEMHDAAMRSKIRTQESEIDRLRLQVFLKERSRVAALSLVSCQAAGWLRVGGAHMTGERSQTTSSMWRYHAVLRKSLLILYSGPGKPRPVDVVSLQGASLLTLEGGRRKKDVNHGFAIRECTGCVRYVLAPNGLELNRWLRELQKAVKTYSGNELVEDDDTTTEMVEVVHSDSGGRGRARTLSSEPESFDEGSAHGLTAKPQRSQIIKERLSKASAITRSSLGTAIKAAKHRGQVGSSNEEDESNSILFAQSTDADANAGFSQPHLNASASTPDQLTQISSTSSMLFANEADVDIREILSLERPEALTSKEDATDNRFGKLRSKTKSKLGSALQGAREKALALSEEMRRKQQERDTGEDSVRSGLRGRIGKAAASVKLSIEKIEVSSTARPAARERNITATEQDQFLSQTTGNYIDDLSEQLETEDVDTSAEYAGQTKIASSVFRTRISKIGAVVKNVTNGNQTAKGSVSVQGEVDGEKASRFSMRRSPRQGVVLREECDLMKLKGIRIGSRLNSVEGSGEVQPSALAKIKGCWVVLVQSRDSTSSQVSESSTEEDRSVTMIRTHPSADPGSEWTTESTVASEVPATVPESGHIEEANMHGEHCRFYVRCLSQDPQSRKKIKVSTVRRSFQDVIGLFIDVLECVHEIPDRDPPKTVDDLRDAAAGMNDDLASSLGISPIDIVKLTGELLGGLLSAQSSLRDVPTYHDYECEVLTEFLNAALQSPLPISGCMAVLEFLDIVDAGVMPIDENGKDASTALVEQSMHRGIEKEPLDWSPEIVALTASCLTHLLRAEASGILAQKLGHAEEQKVERKAPSFRRSATMPTTVPFLAPLLPSSITEGLRDAVHDALKNVMTERDEAQASLIASSLSHLHEIERERKHGDLAKKKLRAAEAETKRLQQGGLFAERFKDPRGGQEWKDAQKYLEEMVKNADNEIKALSQQLAREAADKTAAILEAYRLEDSMKLLRASDLAEKQALADELRKARGLVEELKEKARASDEEVTRLKEILAAQEQDGA